MRQLVFTAIVSSIVSSSTVVGVNAISEGFAEKSRPFTRDDSILSARSDYFAKREEVSNKLPANAGNDSARNEKLEMRLVELEIELQKMRALGENLTTRIEESGPVAHVTNLLSDSPFDSLAQSEAPTVEEEVLRLETEFSTGEIDPRNSQYWAEQINTQINGFLSPDSVVVDVECKAQKCRVDVQHEKLSDAQSLIGQLPSAIAMSGAMHPGAAFLEEDPNGKFVRSLFFFDIPVM